MATAKVPGKKGGTRSGIDQARSGVDQARVTNTSKKEGASKKGKAAEVSTKKTRSSK